MRPVIIILLLLFAACNNQSANDVEGDERSIEKAKKLNNQAMAIYEYSLSNYDSMMKCIALLDKAIKLNDTVLLYRENKYNVLLSMNNKCDQALDVIESLIALDSTNIFYVLNRGFLLESLGNEAAAVSSYKKGIRMYADLQKEYPDSISLYVDMLTAKLPLYEKDIVIRELDSISNIYNNNEYISYSKDFIYNYDHSSFIESYCN